MGQTELIEALGGYKTVAAALAQEIDHTSDPEKLQKWCQRVLKWKQANSIPTKHRVPMLRIAVRAGVSLSPELAKLADDVREALAADAA